MLQKRGLQGSFPVPMLMYFYEATRTIPFLFAESVLRKLDMLSAMADWKASPIFGVPSPRAAAEYWRDVFGFELDPVDGVFAPGPTGPEGVYAIVKRWGVWVHFQIRGDFVNIERSPIACDAYIYVTGVDDLFAQMRARGAIVMRSIEDSAYGLRDFVVEDLNGYRIVFGEFIP